MILTLTYYSLLSVNNFTHIYSSFTRLTTLIRCLGLFNVRVRLNYDVTYMPRPIGWQGVLLFMYTSVTDIYVDEKKQSYKDLGFKRWIGSLTSLYLTWVIDHSGLLGVMLVSGYMYGGPEVQNTPPNMSASPKWKHSRQIRVNSPQIGWLAHFPPIQRHAPPNGERHDINSKPHYINSNRKWLEHFRRWMDAVTNRE